MHAITTKSKVYQDTNYKFFMGKRNAINKLMRENMEKDKL